LSDIYQKDAEYVITIEVPCVNKQDLELSLAGITLKETRLQPDWIKVYCKSAAGEQSYKKRNIVE
jgi:hypothetical protein